MPHARMPVFNLLLLSGPFPIAAPMVILVMPSAAMTAATVPVG